MIKHSYTKTTALLLILTQSVWASPIPAVEIRLPHETPSFLQIEIPEELATVEEAFEAPAKQDPKLILHIQNIHGNYQAQTQVKKMLDYFYKQYAFKVIFVEGASEKLNPEYLEFFPEKENNLKLADALARKGQLTGPELYLMDAPKDVQAIGIEQAELYRGNYEAFKKVYGSKEKTDAFLKKMDSRLELLSSRFLTRDMRRIISEWQKFHDGRREFLPFVKQLSSEAQKFINVDLQSLFAQVEWPQLARLMVLQSMEPDIKHDEALAERDKLLVFLREHKTSAGLIAGIEKLEEKKISLQRMAGEDAGRFEPRKLLEQLVAEEAKEGFRFHQYPNFSLYAGYLILQSELDNKVLFEEIEKLFEKLLDALTTSEKEKNLLEVYKDVELLKKLVALELSRKEWERAIYRKDWINPQALCERFQKLSRDGFVTEDLVIPPALPPVFEAAFSFYDFARKRENYFYQTIRREMDTQHTDRAILVTGGFHTDGLAEMFRNEDVSYGILTPRIGGDFDKTNYINTLMERHPTRFDLAQMEMVNTLQSFPALLDQGLDVSAHLKFLLNDYFQIFEMAYGGTAAQNSKAVKAAIAFFNEHMNKQLAIEGRQGAVGFQIVRSLESETQLIYKFQAVQRISGDEEHLNLIPLTNPKGNLDLITFVSANGKLRILVSAGDVLKQRENVSTVAIPKPSNNELAAIHEGGVNISAGTLSNSSVQSVRSFLPDILVPKLNEPSTPDFSGISDTRKNVLVSTTDARLKIADQFLNMDMDHKAAKSAVAALLATLSPEARLAPNSIEALIDAFHSKTSTKVDVGAVIDSFSDKDIPQVHKAILKMLLTGSSDPGALIIYLTSMPDKKQAQLQFDRLIALSLKPNPGQYVTLILPPGLSKSDIQQYKKSASESLKNAGLNIDRLKIKEPEHLNASEVFRMMLATMQRAKLIPSGPVSQQVERYAVLFSQLGTQDLDDRWKAFFARLVDQTLRPDDRRIPADAGPEFYPEYLMLGAALSASLSRLAASQIDQRLLDFLNQKDQQNYSLDEDKVLSLVRSALRVLAAINKVQASA